MLNMISTYDDLTGENKPLTEEIIISENELLGCCDEMNENELREVWEENPELLGFFFRRIARRIKKRRQYRKSLKGLSKKAKRKAMKAYGKRTRQDIRAKRRKRLKIAALALIPGGRIALAIAKRRAKRKGIPLAEYMKQRRQKRKRKVKSIFRNIGKRIKSRRASRKARKEMQRGMIEDSSSIETSPIDNTFQESTQYRNTPESFDNVESVESIPIEQSTLQTGIKQDFKKYLPLAAAAIAVPFLMQKK